MIQQVVRRSSRLLRAMCLPAALMLAGASAHAQLIGNVLTPVLAPVQGIVQPILAELVEPSATNYAAKRQARLVAAQSANCRAQERHRGMQRVSYGSHSPRNRQLLNDCTLMGPPSDAP